MTAAGSLVADTETAKITIPVILADGGSLSFEVVPRLKAPPCFALSIRKSGSSLFSNLVTAIARFNGFNTIDLPGTAFQNGYTYGHWNDPVALRHLAWRGNVYVGFRDAPTALFADEIFGKAQKILFVRDPLDVLVSEFYSNAFSHSLPKVSPETSEIAKERERAIATTIDEYAVRRLAALNSTADGYQPLLEDPAIKILRYEDFIFRKAALCAEISEHFRMTTTPELIAGILSWSDVIPEAEQPASFIRKVVPGDHQAKLAPATIERIKAQLSPVWRAFGYAN